ncbi:cathelicidin-7-like [Mantella aurantiaca]
MDLVLKVLILLGNLPALFAITIVPSTLNIDEDISQIISDYNAASAGKYLYRLFHSEDQVVESAGNTGVNFTIKETVCKKSARDDREKCWYQPGGVTVKCEAHVVTTGKRKEVSGRCHTGKRKRLFRRDLPAAIQGDPAVSAERSHEQECLECIFTLLPTTKI